MFFCVPFFVQDQVVQLSKWCRRVHMRLGLTFTSLEPHNSRFASPTCSNYVMFIIPKDDGWIFLICCKLLWTLNPHCRFVKLLHISMVTWTHGVMEMEADTVDLSAVGLIVTSKSMSHSVLSFRIRVHIAVWFSLKGRCSVLCWHQFIFYLSCDCAAHGLFY